MLQVADDELVERVTGRRLDPQTNTIYHMKFKPPPADVVDRLIQRSDDTEDSLRNRLSTHHKNVEAVVGYYKDMLVEVSNSNVCYSLLKSRVMYKQTASCSCGIEAGDRGIVLCVVRSVSAWTRYSFSWLVGRSNK